MIVSQGSSFVPPPEGQHLAICYSLVDMGTQVSEYNGEKKSQRKVQLGWELPLALQDDGSPYTIRKSFTARLHEKSNLYKFLTAWRGKKLTAEELGGFDLTKLIRVACQLGIVHDEKNGKTYANVASISGLLAGTQVPKLHHEPVIFMLDNYSRASFEKLSDRMREVISGTPEYKRVAGDREPGSDDDEIPFS